jgi:hypothetical protein
MCDVSDFPSVRTYIRVQRRTSTINTLFLEKHTHINNLFLLLTKQDAVTVSRPRPRFPPWVGSE